MNRVIMFIIFIALASAVYFGLHFFVYKSLVRSLLQDAPAWRKIIKWLFWFSGLSFLAAQLLSRLLKIFKHASKIFAICIESPVT